MNWLLKTLAVVTAGVIYLVLQMGALVTNTGSADGCGESWPLCKGTWMPDWDYAAIVEFSHRGVAGLSGLLVLALHFGISLLCFSAVLLVALLLVRGSAAPGPPVEGSLRRWVWVVAVFAYGVIYLGAYVRHGRASLACFGWPLCNGELVPPLYGPAGANFAHRLGAGLVILLVVRLFLMARVCGRPALRRLSALAVLLVLMQAASGAVIAQGHFNLLTQMMHTAIVTLFWGALSCLCLAVAPPVGRAPGRLPSGSIPG